LNCFFQSFSPRPRLPPPVPVEGIGLPTLLVPLTSPHCSLTTFCLISFTGTLSQSRIFYTFLGRTKPCFHCLLGPPSSSPLPLFLEGMTCAARFLTGTVMWGRKFVTNVPKLRLIPRSCEFKPGRVQLFLAALRVVQELFVRLYSIPTHTHPLPVSIASLLTRASSVRMSLVKSLLSFWRAPFRL